MSRLQTLELMTDELAVRLARLERRVDAVDPPERPDAPKAPPVVARVPEPPREERAAKPPREEDAAGLGWTSVASATVRHVGRTPIPHAPPPAPAPAPVLTPSTKPGLEEILGGRVLAWTGGVVVLAGILLLVAIGVSRGWIGEGLRTTLGALASFSLVAAGAWLHERKGQTEAALAATAAGLAGLFAVAVVASRVYELVPPLAGAELVFGVGALGTTLALRWSAQGMAALALLGGLAAPVLVGAPADTGTAALLLIGAACASVVCVRRRWDWLALGAYAVVTPQWALGDVTLLPLVAFGLLTAATAVAMVWRERRTADGTGIPSAPLDPRAVPLVLLVANAFVLVAAGWFTLDHGTLWLASLAAAHAALAAPLIRLRHPLGLTAATLAVAVADLTLPAILAGPALAAAWSASAVAFALLVRHLKSAGAIDRGVAETGLGAHVALALMGTLMSGQDFPETPALVALAIACFTSGVVLADRPEWRNVLNALGLATVTGLAALTLAGPALAVAWAAEAAVLAHIARRHGDELAGRAQYALLALAGCAALVIAPPEALLEGLTDPAGALAVLAAVAFAGWRILGPAFPAGVALYAASIGVVTVSGAGAAAQTALSTLWGLTGLVLLIAGLRTDEQPVRTVGFALLGVALGKVLLHDLAELTPEARVGSMLALGVLLLAGGYAWQRIRPQERGGSLGNQTPR